MRLSSRVVAFTAVISAWPTAVKAPAGPPLWLRYPAISPDGQTIAFSYQGDIYFGIPMGGWRTPDGKFGEGNQFEPDIKVRMNPAVLTAGRDEQIEAAVEELLKKKTAQ